MAWPLRQSTAGSGNINIVKMGPFLDATDGVTEEVGLAGNGTEVSKNGAAFAAGAVLGTHDAEGYYPVTMTAALTDTLGALRIKSHDPTTHFPVWLDCLVMPPWLYDIEIGGKGIEAGILTAVGSASSVTGWSGMNGAGTTDYYKGRALYVIDGTGDAQIARISASSSASPPVLTLSPAFQVAPSTDSYCQVVPIPAGNVDDAALQAIVDDWEDAGRLDVLLDAVKAATDLLTAAHAEPTGVPAANETPLDKIGYLFMVLRNKVTVTASKKTFYDDGDVAEFEKDLSDDGTTYTETETNAI